MLKGGGRGSVLKNCNCNCNDSKVSRDPHREIEQIIIINRRL